jgi:hypothetical protein
MILAFANPPEEPRFFDKYELLEMDIEVPTTPEQKDAFDQHHQ